MMDDEFKPQWSNSKPQLAWFDHVTGAWRHDTIDSDDTALRALPQIAPLLNIYKVYRAMGEDVQHAYLKAALSYTDAAPSPSAQDDGSVTHGN